MTSIKNIFQMTFLLATFFLFTPQIYANPLGDKEVALFKAIEESDIQTVESLLEQGVDLEPRDPTTKATPLMTAFTSFIMGEQSSQITEALISAGADLEARDINGETLLHTAVALTSANLREFFIQSGNEQLLTSLQQQNCIKGIEILLNAEADIEARSGDGMSVLQIAIGWGSDTEVVEMLIEKGADVNGVGIYDVGAMPPLLLALLNNRLDLMEYLIIRGADVHVRSSTEETLLHPAATANLFEAIEMLVNAGIDVDATDDKGMTPLHLAAAENHIEAVTTLLSLGADREAIDSFGKKPEDRSSITFDLE